MIDMFSLPVSLSNMTTVFFKFRGKINTINNTHDPCSSVLARETCNHDSFYPEVDAALCTIIDILDEDIDGAALCSPLG